MERASIEICKENILKLSLTLPFQHQVYALKKIALLSDEIDAF